MSKSTGGIKVFTDIIKSINCPPELMILCPDQIRRERALEKIISNFKLSSAEKIILSIGSSDTSQIDGLLFKTAEISLFSKEKIIFIRDIHLINADKTDALLNLIKNNQHAKIMITGDALAANSRLYKYFSGKHLLVELEKLESNELLRWLEKEANGLQIKLTGKALELLAEMSEHNADLARKMLEQAAIYTDNQELTAEQLLELFPRSTTANQFKLVELINARQLIAAELEMRALLENESSHFGLLGLLHKSYFMAFLLSLGLKNGHSIEATGRHLKIPPFVLNKYAALARAQSPEKLKSKLAELLRTDSIFKNRSLGDENALSMLLARLAA